MWIGYSLSEEYFECSKDKELFKTHIYKLLEKPANEISDSAQDLIKNSKTAVTLNNSILNFIFSTLLFK